MGDFIIRTPQPLSAHDFFASEVPDFLQSPEFNRLDPEFRLVPGLVMSSFKDYLIRLQQEELHHPAPATATELERGFSALENLASRSDREIDDLLVVEVFEHLWCPDDVLAAIKARLKPNSLALYRRWIGGD